MKKGLSSPAMGSSPLSTSQPEPEQRLLPKSNIWLIGLILLLALIFAGCSSQPEFPTGKFIVPEGYVEFFPDGKTTAYSNGELIIPNGSYTVNGNEITTNWGDVDFCDPADDGLYTWEFDGEKLLFTLVEDDCGVRRGRMRLTFAAE